jgi:hypothetical protein
MMKWTVKVVSETDSGHTTEQTLVAIERPDRLTVEDLGLSLAESKQLLAKLQYSVVTAQVEEDGAAYRGCADCHQLLHTKGYYRTSFRSAFGRVPLRVRRLVTCSCQGEQSPQRDHKNTVPGRITASVNCTLNFPLLWVWLEFHKSSPI